MICREVEDYDILERYVLGQLTDPERDEFEQHYFDCDSCFSQLQSGLALQEELWLHPPARTQTRGATFRRCWVWTPALAAMVLLVTLGIWRYEVRGRHQEAATSTPQTQAPAPAATRSLEELARVEPPEYSPPPLLRGAEDDAHQSFRAAMDRYSKKDYAGAIPGLRAAIKAQPHAFLASPASQNLLAVQSNYYLAVCYLMTDQTDAAIESLRETISFNDPSYSEDAHFYLAKTFLRKKDVAAAETELRTTIQLGGSKAAEAGEILRQLPK